MHGWNGCRMGSLQAFTASSSTAKLTIWPRGYGTSPSPMKALPFGYPLLTCRYHTGGRRNGRGGGKTPLYGGYSCDLEALSSFLFAHLHIRSHEQLGPFPPPVSPPFSPFFRIRIRSMHHVSTNITQHARCIILNKD